jgi:hypothetical protein
MEDLVHEQRSNPLRLDFDTVRAEQGFAEREVGAAVRGAVGGCDAATEGG